MDLEKVRDDARKSFKEDLKRRMAGLQTKGIPLTTREIGIAAKLLMDRYDAIAETFGLPKSLTTPEAQARKAGMRDAIAELEKEGLN